MCVSGMVYAPGGKYVFSVCTYRCCSNLWGHCSTPGGKYVCGVCNLHLVYILNVSRLASPLVTTFSEPFLGFRVSGLEAIFRVPRFFGFHSGQ